MNRSLDLDSTDQLLREWARVFKDRVAFERCRSIESRYNAQDAAGREDGWGDPGAPVIRPPVSLQRAIQTNDAIMTLDRIYRWALTYWFCYPELPRFVVLRCMKKYAGRRLNWGKYVETVDLGRMRAHYAISCGRLLTA